MKKIQMVDLKGQYEKIKAEVDHGIQQVIDSTQFINGHIRDVDRKDLVALWSIQTQTRDKKNVSHAADVADIDVDTRPPSWYERLLAEVAV